MNGSKKIAVNTVVLYIKLIIAVALGLYSSRVILQALGSSDYGLYIVVGGIVSLFNVLGTTMITASYRYMSVEIGKMEKGNPNKVYNTVLLIHLILAFFLIGIGSIIGRWYIIKYLNIEVAKTNDALFVLYLSLITTAISVISVPSNGLIVARENFLFTSIIEILQKVFVVLFLVFFLIPYGGNKLRAYSLVLAILNALIPISYVIYCKIKESKIVKYKINRCLNDYKDILKFTLWTLLSAIAFIVNNQGLAIVVNLFFGTISNAALGIANTIKNYATQFVGSIKQAAVPQIMKNYSAGNLEMSFNLTYRITKYTFFAMLIIVIPIITSMNNILYFWLKEVPDNTNILAILFLICCLVENFGSPSFGILLQASGKIKVNEIIYSYTKILLVPLVFILYKIKYPIYVAPIIDICLTFIACSLQMRNASKTINFKIINYWRFSIWPSLKPLLLICPVFLIKLPQQQNFYIMLINILFVVTWSVISIWILGLDKSEKETIISYMKNKFKLHK